MLEIEHAIPIPESGRKPGNNWTEVVQKMEIGDSVLVSNAKAQNVAATFRTAALRSGFDYKFTTRKIDGGVRIWRVS